MEPTATRCCPAAPLDCTTCNTTERADDCDGSCAANWTGLRMPGEHGLMGSRTVREAVPCLKAAADRPGPAAGTATRGGRLGADNPLPDPMIQAMGDQLQVVVHMRSDIALYEPPPPRRQGPRYKGSACPRCASGGRTRRRPGYRAANTIVSEMGYGKGCCMITW